MRLYEFTANLDQDKKELDFDLADDLIFFMRNDPSFYRTSYFPLVSKFTNRCSKDSTPGPVFFKDIVTDAYKQYKEKFQVEALEEELSIDMLKEICTKIHKEEFEDFKKEQENKKD
jgi:hypothetical protein